jgi:hypothetical protein
VSRTIPRFAVALVFVGCGFVPGAVSAQFRYPPPYPYGGYRYASESNLRIDVTPKEAAVYVDGYFAGYVDEFDGVFQRLHLTPGEHEIVIYLLGFRSIRERLYLGPNTTRRIEGTMERLAAGEQAEPVPQPAEPPESRPPASDSHGPRGRRRPAAPAPPPAPPQATRATEAQGGALMLRVQPGEADVLIDGERWRGPTGGDRLVVQVTEGRHRIEVRKDGYEPFATEVDVRDGESLPLNVNLPRTR